MVKFIFLDVDGVLNNSKLWKIDPFIFDRKSVTNLVHLVKRSGADIVISSTWRLSGLHESSDFMLALRKSSTPEQFNFLTSRIIGATGESDTREKEILEYVEQNPCDRFIAIDDVPELFPSSPEWLVSTNPDVGFNSAALATALSKL